MVLAPRGSAEIKRDVQAIKRGAAKLRRLSKKAQREWFIKHGFITKTGKLTKRYGG